MAKWLKRGALALLAVALLATVATWWLLDASLAELDGEISLSGLSAPARVERDALGVVTVHAANRTDAARALGYVHAQERYFEMDLLRRSAAGELAALFGPVAVERDKQLRVHRMRARVIDNLDAVAGAELPLLEAYRDGVNAGLATLRARPWPYLLLRAEPEPWQLADTALVGYAMFFDLQDETNARELALWRIRQAVPAALYALIAADGTPWDAPLMGAARGDVVLPAAEQLDLRTLPTAPPAVPTGDDAIAASPANARHANVLPRRAVGSEPLLPGSNNFAVAGVLTADGRAIVADDMHLGLRAPNIWFRARLRYADPRAPGGMVDVSGFTLPGIPAVIVGSNTHVAWGFTNSYGDWADWIRLPANGRTDDRVVSETIAVKGAPAQRLDIRLGPSGDPILETLADGTPLALHWAAHQAGSLNMQLGALATAADLEDVLRIADRAGIPGQNLVAADASGRIGWVLTGQPAAATGRCDRTAPLPPPTTWRGSQHAAAESQCWLLPDANGTRPQIVDPPSARLWTANARVADGAALQWIGDNGYALGARAAQIRDDLFTKDRFTEKDLLAIQLDDRALFLQRWWTLLRAVVAANPDDPALQRLLHASGAWSGRASVDSIAYRVTRAFRLRVLDAVMAGLLAPAQAALGTDFVLPDLPQREGVVWQLIEQRPPHLLPRGAAGWDAVLANAARAVERDLSTRGPTARGSLATASWGQRNTAAICHPLAIALPAWLGARLCMPPDRLSGDANMPRVAAPDFGASERMVVSPGHEADGIIHMPGGQSGHPLSPFWGAGHAAWVHGEATPFLPGDPRHTLILHP